jgi:hypothetical protein
MRILPILLLIALAGTAQAQLRVEKRADLTLPITLGPKQAAIVVGFRRPDAMSAGKSGAVAFARYDPAKQDLIFQPRDAKKKGDTTTYWVQAGSGDRKLASDYAVMIVSEGDYVLYGATPGPARMVMNSFCLGAPSFHVGAGETVYFGDVAPYLVVKLVDGLGSAMAYSSHPDDARKAIEKQPALAAGFRRAELHNKTTYACAGATMTAYIVPDEAAP